MHLCCHPGPPLLHQTHVVTQDPAGLSQTVCPVLASCGHAGWLPLPGTTPTMGIMATGFKLENREGKKV